MTINDSPTAEVSPSPAPVGERPAHTVSPSSTSTPWWPDGDSPYFLTDAWPDAGANDFLLVPAKAAPVGEHPGVSHSIALEAACTTFIRGCPEGASLLDNLRGDGRTFRPSTDGTVWRRPDATRDGDAWVQVDPDRPCEDCGEQNDPGEDVCRVCGGSAQYTIRYDNGCPWTTCDPDDPNAVEFVRLDVIDTWTARLDPVTRQAYIALDDSADVLVQTSAHAGAAGHTSLAEQAHNQAKAARFAAQTIRQAYLDRILTP